jgi:hypothetical protein
MFREEPFGRYFSHPFVPGEGGVALKGLVTAQWPPKRNKYDRLITGFCILLRVILTVNNNTFCFATIDKVFY